MRPSFSTSFPRAPRIAAALAAALLVDATAAWAQGVPVRVELRHDSLIVPRDFSAGTVSVRFTAKQEDGAMLHVFRVPLGIEVDAMRAQVMTSSPGRVDAPAAGGPAPGRDTIAAVATMDLRQGRYLVVATSAGGTFPKAKHRYAVMSAVAKSAVIVPPAINVDGTITVSDAAVRASSALRPGRRRMKVHNDGPSQHGVLVVRAKAGRTRADVLQWLRSGKGARPFDWSGGVSPMSAGRDAWIDLELEKGEYLLLCPARGTGGRMHADGDGHGTLTVR